MSSRVYFAQCDFGGPIKVGCSCFPEQRIKTMSSGDLPFNLVNIGEFPGSTMAEAFVHAWFAKSRIRGEWFEPTTELWRWAMEARSTGAVHKVPNVEHLHGLVFSTEKFRKLLDNWRIPLSEIAERAWIAEATLSISLKYPNYKSRFLVASLLVALQRRNLPFHTWTIKGDEHAFEAHRAKQKGKKLRVVAPAPASEAA